MKNPLFKELGGNHQQQNGIGQLIQDAKEMQRTFRGDPRQIVQGLISSGQMSQAQFNQLAQAANQIRALMP